MVKKIFLEFHIKVCLVGQVIIACLYVNNVFLFHMINLSFLGGNSKTAMIAALSPADINYDETLSTLR